MGGNYTLDKLKEWRYVALLCMVLVPFLYISQFNHPSADDYCFTVKAQNEGVWGAQKILFTNWSGRFFSTLITTLGPLYYNSFYLVKVFPVAVLFLAFFSFYKLVEVLYQYNLQIKHLITFSLSFLVLFLLGVNNLPEGLYSYTASLPYILPFIFFILLITLLLKQVLRPLSNMERTLKYLFLVFIIGSNETAAVLMIFFSTSLFIFSLATTKKVNKNLLMFWAISLIITGLVLSSPGFWLNTENPVVSNVSFKDLVVKGFVMTKENVMVWIFKSPLLFFSFVLILFSRKKTTQLHFLKSIHPIFYLLGSFLLMVLLHVFSFYTIDYDHPTRLSVMLFGFFLVVWFFILQETVVYYQNNHLFLYDFLQKHCLQNISKRQFLNAAFIGITVFVLLSSNNLRTVVYETLSGYLSIYDRENEIRYKMIEELEDTDLIQFTIRPKSLYLEDITTEKDAWQNNCYGYYYKMKDGVTLAK